MSGSQECRTRTIGIICGGPSPERGISLNSARSLLDHLTDNKDTVRIKPFYVDQKKQFYEISSAQLYSNNPSDFDFKLHKVSSGLSVDELGQKLREVDLVFPALHGAFGEDGQLQEILEKLNVPYVGSNSSTCDDMFHKNKALALLQKWDYPVLAYISVSSAATNSDLNDQITNFFAKNQLREAVVKPVTGGSSIGVSMVCSPKEAIEKVRSLAPDTCLIQQFCSGIEFTVIVIVSHYSGEPVALIPTQVELDGSRQNHGIFDYRKKYLPTNSTRWYCPPKDLDNPCIHRIQKQAQEIFKRFNMRDFARLDGWVVENEIIFSDFNPISGLEQNSFLFQQATRVGFTHSSILQHIVNTALGRYDHTVEETINWCHESRQLESRLYQLSTEVRTKLHKPPIKLKLPQKFSLKSFIANAKAEAAFIFICLHGGLGENGELQKLLQDAQVPFSGSGHATSQVCIDKLQTGHVIDCLKHPVISSSPKRVYSYSLLKNLNEDTVWKLWSQLALENGFESFKYLVIKPRSDGCSCGVVALSEPKDLLSYVQCLNLNKPFLKSSQDNNMLIEMPTNLHEEAEFILEPFVATDKLLISDNNLILTESQGWIEVTTTIVESKGAYHAFNPSITIAKNSILSIEEKFQGGTGVNLTPPPCDILPEEQCKLIKSCAEFIGSVFSIKSYARLDMFCHRTQAKLILIEVNTLPGLTPSTVLYQQALAETPPIDPYRFLENVVKNGLSSG